MNIVDEDQSVFQFDESGSPDSSEDSSYVHNVREQMQKELEENAKDIEEESITDMHQDNATFFLNFYSKAMNPSDDYLKALEICDLPTAQAYAEVSGTYRKYCKGHDGVLLMPKFNAGTWNPLNDIKNVRERASRSSGSFMDMLWSNKMAFVKPTFPKEISEAYKESDSKEEFRDLCWDTLKTFFHNLQELKTNGDNKLGMHANLHLWKTEKPFKPHLHFHCAIPMHQAPYVTSKDREKAINTGRAGRLKEQYEELEPNNQYRDKVKQDLNNELANNLGVEKVPMHDYGKGHAFDSDLLRTLWKSALEKNFPTFMDNSDIDEVNVHISWASRYKDPQKIMHKFRYKSRLPTIDFFHYYEDNSISNEEYMNKDFMEHVFWYSNSARCYGFMKWANNISEYDAPGLMHRCPICGSETRDVEDDDFNGVHGHKVIQEERYGYLGMDPPDDSTFKGFFH